DHGDALDGLCGELGVHVKRELVTSAQQVFRLEGQRESRYNIVGTAADEHPSNTTLARGRGRFVVALVGAGALDKSATPPEGLTITPTLRAASGPAQLAMAIESSKGGRALVLGDADLAADGLIAVAGNAYFLLDGVRWLAHDEESVGEVASEEDVPVLHRTERDRVWFYGTSFVVPAGVLGIGLWGTRRRRSGRRAS
ncbi:MAG: hypothetical protein AAB426_01660, partial [Myxococcota bacterium]